MNSFPATDMQLVTNSTEGMASDLRHRSEIDSHTRITENAEDGNKVVPSYESATSNILDIFSTGEVTKAQNGDFQMSDSQLLMLLDLPTQKRLSDNWRSKQPKQAYSPQPSDPNDDFWSVIDPSSVDDKTENQRENRKTSTNNPNADPLPRVTNLESDLPEQSVNQNAGIGGDFLVSGRFYSEEGNIHLQKDAVGNEDFEAQTFDLRHTPPMVHNNIPDFKQASLRNKNLCDSNNCPGQELLISQPVFGSISSAEVSDLISVLSEKKTHNVDKISPINQDTLDSRLVSPETVFSSEENSLDGLTNQMKTSPVASVDDSDQAVANNSAVSEICRLIPDLSLVNETTDELLASKNELTCEAKERQLVCTENLDTLIGPEKNGYYWMGAAVNWQDDDRAGTDEESLPEAVQNMASSPSDDLCKLFGGTRAVDPLCSKNIEGIDTVHLDEPSTLSVTDGDVHSAQSVNENNIFASADCMMLSSPQGIDQPGDSDSSDMADSICTIQDIYDEYSIYDLYKSHSEEDTPESHRFSSSPLTITRIDDDRSQNCTASIREINRCQPDNSEEPCVWGLSDIEYLFSEEGSRENGCDTTELAGQCGDLKGIQEVFFTTIKTDLTITDQSTDDLQTKSYEKVVPLGDTNQSPSNDDDQSCETIDEAQSKPNDSIVHNPSSRKLRRNSSKADILIRSKSSETMETPSPLVFSERFSKRIQEKLTREGLYDISKPVSVDEAAKGNNGAEISPDSESDMNDYTTNIATEDEKLDNNIELSSITIPIRDSQDDQTQPTDKTDILFPSARQKDNSGDEQCLYDSTMLSVERKEDRAHGVYLAKTCYTKRMVYGGPDRSDPSAECPRQGERSIYDSYPAYDTDDDSHEKRLSLTYMERKLKTKNRLRIINKICKISSGKAQKPPNRTPIKIFRGNPIC